MATKAELEAELADLKAQLAENAAKKDTPPPEEAPDERSEDEPFEISETFVKDLVKEVETFATDKPLVTLLAVFLVGYVIGRAR